MSEKIPEKILVSHQGQPETTNDQPETTTDSQRQCQLKPQKEAIASSKTEGKLSPSTSKRGHS